MGLSKDIECDKMFKLLEEYNGKMDIVMLAVVTMKMVQADGWITTQRSNHTTGKLREDRVAKLEKISFVWNVRGKQVAKKEYQDKSD